MKNKKKSLKENEIITSDVKSDLINRRSALTGLGKWAVAGASIGLFLNSCGRLPDPRPSDTADSDSYNTADSD